MEEEEQGKEQKVKKLHQESRIRGLAEWSWIKAKRPILEFKTALEYYGDGQEKARLKAEQ